MKDMNDHLKSFIKDKLFITIVFFLNCGFLILFFYLSQNNNPIVFYPLAITGFMYMLYIIVEWIRYYQFNKNLEESIDNFDHRLPVSTYQQEQISEVIDKIHQKYIREIHQTKIDIREQKRFLSQLIHNIKTPISVIDLILQNHPDSDNEALEEIKEEKDRLYKLLENVLNVLRIDDFSQDYVTEQVKLVEEVKRMINQSKKQFIHQQIYPRLKVNCQEPIVLTDRKWNQVMLDQFISNAIKYSSVKEGDKQINFIIESKEDKVFLRIIDQGIGIPDYDQNKVFEPFFTGENGRKQSNSTGIGLYICSKIAEKLGHELSLQSEKGQGTEIRVSYFT